MRAIGWVVAIIFVAGLVVAGCIAVVNDEDSMPVVQLVSHDDGGGYECDPYYEDCRGYDDRGGYYEDERGSRNGRDKRTCFFGCDNIIVVPNPLDPGGGQDGSEQPRSAHT